MKPHVHAASIKDWADGYEMQVQRNEGGPWWDVEGTPSWCPVFKYRRKPDPYARFKEALAAGERVDVRDPSKRYGWRELDPVFDSWHLYQPEQFRIARPWQDERDAQAAGDMVQCANKGRGDWQDGVWAFDSAGMEYRIKPREIIEQLTVTYGDQFGANLVEFVLEITSVEGKTTDVKLKEWHA